MRFSYTTSSVSLLSEQERALRYLLFNLIGCGLFGHWGMLWSVCGQFCSLFIIFFIKHTPYYRAIYCSFIPPQNCRLIMLMIISAIWDENGAFINFILMSVLPSSLQRRFITTSMYKRSKNYFDISRLNQIQQRRQQERRKPYLDTAYSEQVDSKLQQSFVSAQMKLNERLQTECAKHQKRFFHQDCDETETNYTLEGRKGKTLDMSKMLSREYFEREGGQSKTETHFCNFREYRPPANHKVDFRKFYIPKDPQPAESGAQCTRCRTRLKSAAEGRTAEFNGDMTGKIHEKLIFDESIFKATVDYKRNDREVSQRAASPSPEKNLDLILAGEQLTKKRPGCAAVQFYHGNSKWASAQMDNRLLKQNEYFLKAYNAKGEKQLDWSIVKRKSDLVQRRRREILMRKRIKDVKGEICDGLYFRRNHH